MSVMCQEATWRRSHCEEVAHGRQLLDGGDGGDWTINRSVKNDRPVLPKGHAQPKGNRVYKSPGRGAVAGASPVLDVPGRCPAVSLMESDGGVTFKCGYSMRKVKARGRRGHL